MFVCIQLPLGKGYNGYIRDEWPYEGPTDDIHAPGSDQVETKLSQVIEYYLHMHALLQILGNKILMQAKENWEAVKDLPCLWK